MVPIRLTSIAVIRLGGERSWYHQKMEIGTTNFQETVPQKMAGKKVSIYFSFTLVGQQIYRRRELLDAKCLVREARRGAY